MTHKTLEGFILGHYDSRGGTTFLVGKDRKKAEDFYWTNVFAFEPSEAEDDHNPAALFNEDFVCEAKLHVPIDFDMTEEGIDLENEGRVLSIMGNSTKPLVWDDEDDESEEDDGEMLDKEYQAATEGRVIELEFVPEGKQPTILKSWHHPRWDDDAFGFIVYDIK